MTEKSNLKLEFKLIQKTKANVAIVTINRPDAANALSAHLIDELIAALDKVRADQNCRALILRGDGKHFCAGADLSWMKASAKLSFEENRTDAQRLIVLFETLAMLEVPTLALIQGSCFGGAVGLAAACDIVIATKSARFCLSEARLGLIPAVIFPYLSRKMTPGNLRRYALSAQVFGAAEAQVSGLVQIIANEEKELLEAARQELNTLLQASPQAQKELKNFMHQVFEHQGRQGLYTADAIARLRTSQEGQEGLQAFFDKSGAPWILHLDQDWSFHDSQD